MRRKGGLAPLESLSIVRPSISDALCIGSKCERLLQNLAHPTERMIEQHAKTGSSPTPAQFRRMLMNGRSRGIPLSSERTETRLLLRCSINLRYLINPSYSINATAAV